MNLFQFKIEEMIFNIFNICLVVSFLLIIVILSKLILVILLRMCSRGVFQLKKLSLFFCDYGGSSSGVRELISSPKLKDFLISNPQIQLEVICKRNNHPHVKGYFVNGYRKDMPLRSLN